MGAADKGMSDEHTVDGGATDVDITEIGGKTAADTVDVMKAW